MAGITTGHPENSDTLMIRSFNLAGCPVDKKILVIDDDALILKTLKMLLSREKYVVDCVRNGQEAATRIHEGSYHLIICDVRMPGEDGIAVIKNLKKISQEMNHCEIPFIFITGYASENTPIEAIKLGARDYILKPFDLDELMKSIKQNLN
ncbi:MAG: response regulator [Candidatus Omnitrophota bacterium]